jgi:alcohol dehydrogenase class IV
MRDSLARAAMALADLRHRTPASRTFCGDGCLRHLPPEIDRAGVAGVAIVASRSARRHEAFTRLTSTLGDRAVTVFDGVREHTPVPVVESLVEIVRDTGAQGLVAVGGGSAIVTARAGAIAHGEQLPVGELATRRLPDGTFHSPRLTAPKIPTWVVPTTPTTAYARVGAAVRDPATSTRLALYDPATRAAAVFIDAELSLTAPPSVALGAALNAVSMAAEGLQSRRDDPMADALLGHGLRVLLEWLPELIARPDAGEPRMRLMLGALMAGQGSEFSGGGLAQTLAHAAGPLSTVSNGVLEAILLPHTLRYNLAGDPEALDAIAKHLGLSRLGHLGPVPSEPALRAIADVLERVQVPRRLRDVGIAETDIPTIAQHVLEDWFISQVPRTAKHDDIVGLLREAW